MAKYKQKKRSLISRIMSKRIILTIQFLVSALFTFFIYVLGIVPMKYFSIVIGALVVLFLLMVVYLQRGVNKKRRTGDGKKLAFGKFLSMVLSICMLVASVYIVQGNNFINNISSIFKQTHNISVYVLKDSQTTSIEDIQNATIGVSYSEDAKHLNKGIQEFEAELGDSPKYVDAAGYSNLADALYSGEIEVLIADQAYLSLLEANHEHFVAETRVIATYKIEEEIQAMTSNANVTKEPFIVFITGIDTYGDVSTVARTDVNLVMVVNPKEKQILLVSIPRDTQITLAMNGKMDKLTHSAMYGINETISTLEDFLDINFNYYAKTNFSGIIDIIDALGGVEIDSPHEFITMHGGYHIQKGINQMDGDKALCFVRERYELPMGDFDRGKNQQLLLKAMLDKAMTSKVITNYKSLLSAIEGCFETSMSGDDIRGLIQMQLNDMSSWDIFQVQVAGTEMRSTETYSMYGQRSSVIVPDEDVLEQIIAVIDEMEEGRPISEADLEGLFE